MASKFDPRSIKVADQPEDHRAGKGLLLNVSKSGNRRWWCFVIRDGKRAKHTLGYFPAMSLSEARLARETVRSEVREGHDPVARKLAVKAGRIEANAQTVERVGRDWLARESGNWTAPVARANATRLVKYVFPAIGSLPIADVTREHVFGILELHKTHFAQAVAVRGNLASLFDFAVTGKLMPYNLVRANARYLPSRQQRRNPEKPQAHVTTIADARAVLATIEANSDRSSGVLQLVHRLIALTGVRKVEATEAQWSEINLDKAEWTLPASRTKQFRAHVVPLSPQAVEVLQAAACLRTLGGRFVFPSKPGVEDRPTDDSSLNDLFTRRGLKGRHTIHGWRSTFCTILNEQDHTRYRITDMMLGHKPIGGSKAASHYDHAGYAAARREVACIWADQLMVGAPPALALIGMEAPQEGNVVQLWKAA